MRFILILFFLLYTSSCSYLEADSEEIELQKEEQEESEIADIPLIGFVAKFIPETYRLEIQQGNEITSQMLMKLKPGMTKSQVSFALGTPLIQDSFHKEYYE